MTHISKMNYCDSILFKNRSQVLLYIYIMSRRLIAYIHGLKYDLTDFQHIHPGGKLILQFANNREVSQVF